MRRFRVVLWALVAAWAVLIYYLSTVTFGGSFSALLLGKILATLHVHVTSSTFAELDFLFRKAGHTTEYAIFAMLLYVAGAGEKAVRWDTRRAIASIFIAGLYSLTDEYHQSFVPGRGPALSDCALDTLAAAFGMLIVYVDTLLFGGGKPPANSLDESR